MGMVTAIANSGVNIQLSKYNNNVYRHCIVEILAVEPGPVPAFSLPLSVEHIHQ